MGQGALDSRGAEEALDQRGIHPMAKIASPPLFIEGNPYIWRKPPIATKTLLPRRGRNFSRSTPWTRGLRP
jgi:hypothetical protein